MNYAVILSGGTGSRLKGLDIPKQYYPVNGRTILSYCIETVENCPDIGAYVIVAAEMWRESIQSELRHLAETNAVFGAKFLGFADPGENRQLSIYHGLQFLEGMAEETDLVLIQDAARPLTSNELISRCLDVEEDMDGVMPVLPMKDTVYWSRDGKKVDLLLNRSEIFAGQAPETFRFGKYLRANQALLPEEIKKINGSTEPAVKAGMKITLMEGEEGNFKITTVEDLRKFCQIFCDIER